jgi:hypothetical protein
LADADGDGALTQNEFCVAIHCVYHRLSGSELPRRVPDELYLSLQPGYVEPERPSVRERVVSEQQRVLQAFAAADAGPPTPATLLDLFGSAPTASSLHHATRDRPTIRCAPHPLVRGRPCGNAKSSFV